MNTNAYFAFVTTNSICQGSQVPILWKHLLERNVEISFAYKSFKWTNNAKSNAGVTCVIIGMRGCSNKSKHLIDAGTREEVKNINGYLLDANYIYINSAKKQISSSLPSINYGSFALDDGNYTLSSKEADEIISINIEAKNYIKEFIGAKELIQGIKRYCIWINEENYDSAKKIAPIASRIQNVYNWRSNSDRANTKKLAAIPYRFAEIRQPLTNYIALPTVSSERREYLPTKFLSKDTIASNQIFIIPTNESWIFGVVNSRMHMVWVRAVAGRLKTDYRYSAELCYNTFPFPEITDKQKQTIEMHVNNILAEREKHSDKTMAELYDPDKMPQGLREAHHSLDLAIEKCYRQAPFESDEKRLEHLFKRYEIMTDPTKQNNPEAQLSLL